MSLRGNIHVIMDYASRVARFSALRLARPAESAAKPRVRGADYLLTMPANKSAYRAASTGRE